MKFSSNQSADVQTIKDDLDADAEVATKPSSIDYEFNFESLSGKITMFFPSGPSQATQDAITSYMSTIGYS